MANLNFLNVEEFCRKLTPVLSTEFFSRSGGFNQEGLFSEDIFGPEGSFERRQKFSYIDLGAYVLHPTAYKILKQIHRKFEKYISTEEKYIITDGKIETAEEGRTGLQNFMEDFDKIEFRGETRTREKLIFLLKESNKKGLLFIRKLPVIPPDLRPIFKDESNQWIHDSLNDIYLSVMYRASQIKSVGSKGELFDLLNFSLQTSVNSHDDFIRTRVQKKDGIIRNQLLGKRVDFSGRAVITPGPDLKVSEVGLPFKMAVKLLEPFIIHILLHTNLIDKNLLSREIKKYTKSELNVDTILQVIKSIKIGDEVPKELYDIFFQATEIASKDRVVLLKRDPVLHDQGYGAFYIKIHHGNTMQLCALRVGGFNADFDGDAMGVFLPLSKEAQEEAKMKMMRLTAGSSTNSMTFELSKEMALGLYSLTKDVKVNKSPVSVSKELLEKGTNPYLPVIFKKRQTTLGRAIFNYCFPEDFRFVDGQINKKIVNNLIQEIYQKYGKEITLNTFLKVENIGFKWATIFGDSLPLDELTIPDSIIQLKKKMSGATIEEASDLLEKMKKILIEHLKDTGLYEIIESGAGKGWDSPMQILVAKGIIADPKGNVLPPIESSFSEGLTNKQYFEASSGSRHGIISRVISTSQTGYFARKLVYLLNSVEADPILKDCKTKRTLNIRLTKEMVSRFMGRYILKNDKIIKFEESGLKEGDIANIRTPIFCESLKICHTCYGDLLKVNKTPYIGIFTALKLGQMSTQNIMRVFHTGGKVTIAKRNMLKDILENNPSDDLEL